MFLFLKSTVPFLAHCPSTSYLPPAGSFPVLKKISFFLCAVHVETFSIQKMDTSLHHHFHYYDSTGIPCIFRDVHPGLFVLMSLLVSVDVKLYWTMLRHWSQLVPNMSTDIWGHQVSHHRHHHQQKSFEWDYKSRPHMQKDHLYTHIH